MAEQVEIKPLADRVVVKPIPVERKTVSGIIMPDTVSPQSSTGLIVAVGSGRIAENGVKIPFSVSVGQKVLYAKQAGTEVKDKGESYLIMKEADLIAVLHN